MVKPNRIRRLDLIAFSPNDLLRQPPAGGGRRLGKWVVFVVL